MYVGLDLAFNGVNYGMLLQAYATQVVFDDMGVKTEIINYKRTDKKGVRPTPYLAFFFLDKVKARMKAYFLSKNNKPSSIIQQKNIELRKEVAINFRNEKLHDIVECYGYNQLCELGKRYDAVVVGSDQLWLPEAAFGVFRTLRFVPDDVLKISYATSLGVSEYPFYCKSSARQFLNRFDYISVREKQGKKIIETLTNKPVQIVVDPTYLLTYEKWLELIPYERNEYGEYVLCYFLGSDERARNIVKSFAKKHSLKLISILSNESFLKTDDDFGTILVGKSPDEFINLIRNAKYVFTDSFHGLAFSVINRKNFYIFYRKRVGATSRGSRIDNILEMWGLESRLLINGEEISLLNDEHIDYKAVERRIEEKRKASLKFIRDSLGGV